MRSFAGLIRRCVLACAILPGVVQAAQLAPTAAPRGPLGLADDEFWGNVERTRDAVVADIGQRDFQGILIDAPRRIALGKRQSLPVVGYFVRSLRDDRVLDQQRQMIVVAVDQQTGRAHAGLALHPGKEPVRQAPADDDPGEGTTLNLFTSDLRRTLALPWEAGTYRVTVLLGRFVSNQVVVELVAEPAQGPAPIVPSADKPAIELARKGKKGCQVAGRLVPPPADRLAKVLLLATGAQSAGPWTVSVDVPAASKAKRKQAAGTFAVDLLRAPDLPKGGQDYFVYAFGPSGAAGPVVCPAAKR